MIAVYWKSGFAKMQPIGWGWAGVIWLYSLVTFVPLDLFKFAVRYVLSGRAWNNVQNKTAFTTKKEYGREEREAQWATTQRSLHGLPAPDLSELQAGGGRGSYAAELSEVARFRETSTLRGHLESSAKLRGIDISAVKSPYYTM